MIGHSLFHAAGKTGPTGLPGSMEITRKINTTTVYHCLAIRSLHDFLAHTNLFYQFFEEHAVEHGAGYFVNEFAGTGYRRKHLLQLLPAYKDHYLSMLVFQHLIHGFERFLYDALRDFFEWKPEALSGGKSVRVSDLRELVSKQEVNAFLIDRELQDLFYAGFRDVFKQIESRTGISIQKSQIDQLVEMKATRDVLVHNMGVANEQYERKTGVMARVQSGERVEITKQYLSECFDTVISSIEQIGHDMFEHFGGTEWLESVDLRVDHPIPGYQLACRKTPAKLSCTHEELLDQLRGIFEEALREDGFSLSYFDYADESSVFVGFEPPTPDPEPFIRDYLTGWATENGLVIHWICRVEGE